MQTFRSSQRAVKGVLRAFLAVTILLSSLGPIPVAAPVASAQSQPAETAQTVTASQPAATEVSITTSGFQPATIEVNAGQPVHFTNASPQTQTVTHDGASANGAVLFDSGDIPPGGGYSVTLLAPGEHAFRSATSAPSGTLRIKATGLPGNPGDVARDHIPDLAFPLAHADDIGTHPQFGVLASRTRIMVGFTPSATVAQVNAAITAADATVIGGLPRLGIALLRVPDSADFSTLIAALASLRASSAIDFAAMSTQVASEVTPRPVETGMTATLTWSWNDRDALGSWAPRANNANLAYVRAPEAWNLLQAIKQKSAPVQTAIVDGGFESHPDLGQLQILTLCRPGTLGDVCTHTAPDDHGNHVSGIVGATYDNDGAEQGRSRGLSGVNPVAEMYGVTYTGTATTNDNWDDIVTTDDELTQALSMTIAEKRAGGVLPNLRVINLSSGAILFKTNPRGPNGNQREVPVWEDRFANVKCGPLDNDDATGTLPCTPANQDDWLREYAQMSHAALAVAHQAADVDVVIVKSAGNNSDMLCDVFGAAPCPHQGAPLPLPAYSTNEFAWAQKNWGGSGFPVILVEAYEVATAITPVKPAAVAFSQSGGDVSAPGWNIFSTASHAFFNPASHDCDKSSAINFQNSGVAYCAMDGTSMAAPHVTGVLGLLFAFRPELTGPEAIAIVKNEAMTDGFSAIGTAPGINAYKSLLALPGALQALLDVNDDTPDGNQRVVLGGGANGSSQNVLGPVSYLPSVEFPASPDGQIDMRDFRRFRDAFLQICEETAAEGVTQPASCPTPGSVVLNGSPTNQKKDLNWDHCAFATKDPNDPSTTRDPKSCTTHEVSYPRFDFNGDGLVDITTPSSVPFGPDGQPLPNAGTSDMTDLDVLLTLWPASQALTEGWSKEQVRSLINSGDLEVHASAFFDAGATEVLINGRRDDGSGELPPRKLQKDDSREALDQNYVLETVPASGLEIWASATLPDGQRIESPMQNVHLLPGEDQRFDLCATHLTLDGGPLNLPADGSAQGIFTATLVGCPGDQVNGKPVTFSLTTPGGNGDASLTRGNGTTDSNGRIVTAVTAGTQAADYTLKAEVDLGNGRLVSVSKSVRTSPTLTISYIWRQTVLDWEENGSTRWPNAPAGMPDCTSSGVQYCIDNFQLRNNTPIPDWQSQGLQRKGQLVGSAEHFKLSEVVGGENWSQATYTIDSLDGTPPQEGHFYGTWGPSASQYNKYQNYAIDGVRTEDTPEAIRLFGLKNVGELGYLHASQTGAGTSLPETHFTRDALLLVPRGDGSAIQSSFNMDGPITFKRHADGSFEPYTFRGVVDTPITSGPHYLQQHPSDWVYGAFDLSQNDTHFDAGDRPQLAINGHLKVLYCFQAVVTYSGTPLPVALPDCAQNHPPTADFDVEFAGTDAGEGRVVQFKDNSSDPDNDIRSWSWDFGEPITPGRQQCSTEAPDSCHVYSDNGIYTVRLTVTDAEGVTASTTKTVVVRNLPPEPGIDTAVGHGIGTQPGCGTISIPVRLWDPGWKDQASLTFRITSSNASWPGSATATLPAGVHSVNVDNLPEGEYPLTFTVTDKDGATASASAMAHVIPCDQPILQPTPQPGAYITCDVNVVLDAEEQTFLNLLNAYRIQNGLKPLLGVSPTLSQAAARHSHDMATHNFMEHVGSDGSTFDKRAHDAGYKGSSVGENIARGMARGLDALIAWKSSDEGHNENMLSPAWVSVGIKREKNTTTGEWFWTTDYGNILDCPTPSPVANVVPAADFGELPLQTVAVLGVGNNTPELFTSQQVHFVAAPLVAAAPATAGHGPAAPAFVISRVLPRVGEAVTFTNATRDANGQPLAATLDLGDGSPLATLAAGATYVHTYTTATAIAVKLVAADVTVARTLTVAVTSPLPGLGQPGDPAAWGYDAEGQLGDGTAHQTRFEVAPVANLANVAAMDGGANFAAALLSDGSVWTWGENGNGELGDGTFATHGWPVPASLPARVRQIAAGSHHVLALDADGIVWTWGANFKGQLGTGNTQGRAAPAPLPGLPPIVYVAAGSDHSLAVGSDGSIWAWGRNNFGQLGFGNTSDFEATPARVHGQDGISFLQPIRAAAGGDNFSVALGADGSVWTWGDDQYGQLGRNTRNLDSTTPVKVVAESGTGSLAAITGVAAGDEFALALATDGSVWGWGRTDLGQVGSPASSICGASSTPCSPRPARAQFTASVKAVATGANHALAITSDNRLWTWGSNDQGELGVGTATTFRVAPEALTGRALAVGAGSSFSLAVRPNETPLAAPTNDAFASATIVENLPAAFSGNTLLATLESSEPSSGACGAIGRSIWYRITPTTSGRLSASTAGSFFDTRLSLYTGASLANLNVAACDSTSVLSTPVQAGQTYYLQLAGKSAFSGTAHGGQFQLSLTLGNTPSNDDLESSQDLTVPVSSLSTDTSFATVQNGELEACSTHTGKSVWFRLVPSSSGSFVFDAAGTGVTPSLALFTSRTAQPTFTSLNPIACSTDVAPRMLDSLKAGTTYYLRVAGDGGAGGPMTLSINPAAPPANDAFTSAANLSVPGAGGGSLLLATVETDEPSSCFASAAPSVWYRVQASQTGRMTLRVSSARTINATLYRTHGDGLTNLDQLQNGCGFDPDPVTGAYVGEIQAGVSVGQTLYLQVVDPDSAGLPFTIDSTINTQLPDLSVSQFTAPSVIASDQPLNVLLEARNSGAIATSTGFAAQLHADTPTARRELGPNGTPLEVQFPALASGAASSQNLTIPGGRLPVGSYMLTLELDGTDDVIRELDEANNTATRPLDVTEAAAAARDAFADATLLPLPGSAGGNTTSFTTETGEPLSCGSSTMGRTSWFRVAPTATGALTLDAAGSDFDTVIALYTGTSLNTLQQVACNDDAASGVRTSRLVAAVQAAVPYYVQLGGYNGASGNFSLVDRLDTSGKPDLAVTSLVAAPSSADQPVPVTVSITNTGSSPSPAVQVRLYADPASAPQAGAPTPLPAVDFDALGIGARATNTVVLPAGTLAEGPHTLWAVVDGAGAVAETDETNNTATTQVSVDATVPAPTAPDFSIAISPASLVLVPGSSASLTISTTSLLGFQQPVSLSVSGLPQGVTGTFVPATVTPSGTSVLALTASASTVKGTFPVTVTAKSGSLIHVTGSNVSVDFGLVPLCYGAFSGRIVDQVSGAPMSGVRVGVASRSDSTATDADGRFTLGNLPLGTGNAPQQYVVVVSQDSYWSKTIVTTAVCGATVPLTTVQLIPLQQGTVAGDVRIGVPDPNNHNANRTVTAGSDPVPSVSLTFRDSSDIRGTTTADANGHYTSPELLLNDGNTARAYAVRAEATGYWPEERSLSVAAGTNALNLALVPQCTATITGVVLGAQSGASIEARATVGSALPDQVYTTTTSGQVFTLTGVLLGLRNSRITYTFAGYSDAAGTIPAQVTVNDCATSTSVILQRVQSGGGGTPAQNLAIISGQVTDSETGQAIVGASIAPGVLGLNGVVTDSNGHYVLPVAWDPAQPSLGVSLGAARDGYWPKVSSVNLTPNQNLEVNINLLRKRYGVVNGVVRDASTLQGIDGAHIQDLQGASLSGTGGVFTSDSLEVGPNNQPRDTTFSVSATGYWTKSITASLEADKTTNVNVDLVKVCAGATISGRVLNSTTVRPIEGATVKAQGKTTLTDKDGLFTLANLTVGFENSPIQAEVQVTADGFNAQTKSVTIFCGANLTLNFGDENLPPADTAPPVTSAVPAPVANAEGWNSTDVSVALSAADNVGGTGVKEIAYSTGGAQTIVGGSTAAVNVTAEGTTTLTYFARDNAGNQEAPHTLTLHLDKTAPVATGASLTTPAGVPVALGLHGTDNLATTLTFAVIQQPAHGALSGTVPNVTYTPQTGFTGTDGFTFTVSDGLWTSSPASVSISVAGAPDVSLTKTHSGSFTVGKKGTYTLTVTNVGSVPTSSAMIVTDTLPAGLTYASATGTGWACAPQGQVVTCSNATPLAPAASSSFSLSVNVANAAVPSVTNSATVVAVGDSHSSNDTASDPTTVKPVADTTPPSCNLTKTATDAQGRKYVEVTVQDTGSGLNQVQVVEQVNLTPSLPTFTVGTTTSVVVRLTKIDQALSSQFALHITDVAGNATDCDPIDQVLTRTPGKPESYEFDNLPQTERYIQVVNGTPGVTNLVLTVNHKRFKAKNMKDGEVRVFNVGKAMKPGDQNTLVAEVRGKPAGTVWLLMADQVPPGVADEVPEEDDSSDATVTPSPSPSPIATPSPTAIASPSPTNASKATPVPAAAS